MYVPDQERTEALLRSLEAHNVQMATTLKSVQDVLQGKQKEEAQDLPISVADLRRGVYLFLGYDSGSYLTFFSILHLSCAPASSQALGRPVCRATKLCQRHHIICTSDGITACSPAFVSSKCKRSPIHCRHAQCSCARREHCWRIISVTRSQQQSAAAGSLDHVRCRASASA